MIVLGVDPGTVTGLAAYDANARQLLKVESWTILEAMQQVLIWRDVSALALVIFEDARRRTYFGKMDAEQAKYGAAVREGVGAVKRDCAIWEEFLTAHQIPFEGRTPRNTKMKAEPFRLLTNWAGKTNEHSRDAALIVHGMNAPMVQAKLIALSNGRAGPEAAGSVHSGRRTGNGRRRRNSPG